MSEQQRPASAFRPQQSRSQLGRSDLPLRVFTNTDFWTSIGSDPGSGWEDSVAKAGQVVFQTGNYFAAYSSDGGASFSYLNPYDGLGFPTGEAFCCDQQVVYAPSIDRIIWVRQTVQGLRPNDAPDDPTGPNRYRISVAKPADIVSSGGMSWTSWDITPATFGWGSTTPSWWFDYPDLVVGANNAYLSFNVIGSGQAALWRIPLSRLANAENLGGTRFAFPPCSGLRVAQGIGSTAYFACQLTTSRLRSFSWAESSTGYGWRDLDHPSTPTTYSSKALGSSIDFLSGSKISYYLTGAAYRSVAGEAWYAWSAGSGNGFPHPHIQYLRVRTSDNLKIADGYVWNSKHTFVWPDIATNDAGEVGLSFTWGGDDFAVHSGVGFLTDPRVFVNTSPDGITSGGHYDTIRRDSPDGRRFAVGNYWAPAVPPASWANHPQFIVFGRP